MEVEDKMDESDRKRRIEKVTQERNLLDASAVRDGIDSAEPQWIKISMTSSTLYAPKTTSIQNFTLNNGVDAISKWTRCSSTRKRNYKTQSTLRIAHQVKTEKSQGSR